MTRVCVTGASGYLGSHICRGLVKPGYELICVDIVPSENDYGEFRQVDFRNAEETLKALEGAEILVHCASIHPWKSYTDEEYLDNNVKGTWNVFRAALEHGIDRVILTSSIAASGYSPEPDLCPVDESYQQQSLGEMIARHFCRNRNMKVIALRPPNFTPKPPLQNGAALLSGCLVVEDIASAHLKALDIRDKVQEGFEPFFITAAFPYSLEEEQELSDDPKGVLDKHFPGAWDWFQERGVKLHPVATHYDSSKAKRVLGWQPDYTFDRWWEENSSKL